MALKDKKSEKDASRPTSPLLPMFRASVASAPGTFLSAAWLTTPNVSKDKSDKSQTSGCFKENSNHRNSLSTINSEVTSKDKEINVDESSHGNNTPTEDNDTIKKRHEQAKPVSSILNEISLKNWLKNKKSFGRRKDLNTTTRWKSLETLSRALVISALIFFSIGVGLTAVGFGTSSLSAKASVTLQIVGPVLLAGAVMASSLGVLMARLWHGEWKQRQLEMDQAVKSRLEKLAKEIIFAQHQELSRGEIYARDYPQLRQKWITNLSPSCSKIVDEILADLEISSKSRKRQKLQPPELSETCSPNRKNDNFSTETTTANSRRSSSRLNSFAEISWKGRESVSGFLLKHEIEKQLQGKEIFSSGQIPVYDLPGIQISRIETIDLDQASAGSSSIGSTRRYIIVHGDLTSSQFSFASEYSLMSSNARSRSSNEASLFEFSPRESEWDADISLCSRDSQTSIAFSRSSRGSGREFSRLFYHHYPQPQQQQQQQLLLLPPPNDKYFGKYSNGPPSPRRHSSPVSSQNRKINDCNNDFGTNKNKYGDKNFRIKFNQNSEDNKTDSESSLIGRNFSSHPYSSCSPLLLKVNSSKSENNNVVVTRKDSIKLDTKAESNLQQIQSNITFIAHQNVQRMYKERKRMWYRKRSDQSILSMKINEHEDDDDETKSIQPDSFITHPNDSLESNKSEKFKSFKFQNGCEPNSISTETKNKITQDEQIVFEYLSVDNENNSNYSKNVNKPNEPHQHQLHHHQEQQQLPSQYKCRRKSSSLPPQPIPYLLSTYHQSNVNDDEMNKKLKHQCFNIGDKNNTGGSSNINNCINIVTNSNIHTTVDNMSKRSINDANNSLKENIIQSNVFNSSLSYDEDKEIEEKNDYISTEEIIDKPNGDAYNNLNSGLNYTDTEKIDPRWRHFFGGSCAMALVASTTVASMLDRKRTSLKRNNTDDSEVERRVAKLLKEIEMSATDSLEESVSPSLRESQKDKVAGKKHPSHLGPKYFARRHKHKQCRPLVNVPVASKLVGTESYDDDSLKEHLDQTTTLDDKDLKKENVGGKEENKEKMTDDEKEKMNTNYNRTKQRRFSYAAAGSLRKHDITSSSSSSQPTSMFISSSFSSRTNRSAEVQTIAFEDESNVSKDFGNVFKKSFFHDRSFNVNESEKEILVNRSKGQETYGSFKDNNGYDHSIQEKEHGSLYKTDTKYENPDDSCIKQVNSDAACSSKQSSIPLTSAKEHSRVSHSGPMSTGANRLKIIAKSFPQILVAATTNTMTECSKLMSGIKNGGKS